LFVCLFGFGFFAGEKLSSAISVNNAMDRRKQEFVFRRKS
jgi:hypothetical protein